MANLTASKDEVYAPTRMCICSECGCRFILVYIWIDYCPSCGVKFDVDTDKMPVVLMSDGSIAPYKSLSGAHQLRVYGKLGIK